MHPISFSFLYVYEEKMFIRPSYTWAFATSYVLLTVTMIINIIHIQYIFIIHENPFQKGQKLNL